MSEKMSPAVEKKIEGNEALGKGNLHVWVAIERYTEGLALNEMDNGLNAMLYSNRAGLGRGHTLRHSAPPPTAPHAPHTTHTTSLIGVGGRRLAAECGTAV